MSFTFTNRFLASFVRGVLTVLAFAGVQPASAQVEFGLGASADALKFVTAGDAPDYFSVLYDVQAGYRTHGWLLSAEHAAGGSRTVDRTRAELRAGYALSDSVAISAGARRDDITLSAIVGEFFFFVPIGIVVETADVNLTNGFIGIDYESARSRPMGLIAAARLYGGRAVVDTPAGEVSKRCRGYRAELGTRFGRPKSSWILGAAYETFRVSDVGIDIRSEPVLFVRWRYVPEL